MPFGLSNVISNFMRLMTQVLRLFLNKFVVVYSLFQRQPHLHHIGGRLPTPPSTSTINLDNKQALHECKEVCFLVDRLVFLAFINSQAWVEVDQTKAEAIRSWPISYNGNRVAFWV